jgi:hypothetical protein
VSFVGPVTFTVSFWRAGGLAVGPFKVAAEPMTAADQYLVSHIDSTS